MKFRSELDLQRQAVTISYPQSVLLAGSCFTEHMGDRLRQYRFPVLQNPHGILFNPISIGETLLACLENRSYGEEDLFWDGQQWNSWSHHSRFSNPDKQKCLLDINTSVTAAHAFLEGADWLMLTLGSAWVYQHRDTGRVVANNHKAPATTFTRRLLSLEELLSALDTMVHRLFTTNEVVRIIFTISPVRHLREGMVDNNRSKAVLIQAVHHLAAKYDRIDYFPAYELVVDDLRDYRFYAEDLVHPNYQATQYVWEKFTGAFMDDKTLGIMQSLDPILTARKHKPFHPSSEEHKKFLRQYADQCKELMSRFPFLDLSEERQYFTAE